MKKFLLIIIIIAAVVFFVRFVIGGSEDSWLCEAGRWVKHGEPAAPKPTRSCPLTLEQESVKTYVEENISEISPMEPVLGGTWQVLDVEFLEDKIVDVTYEEGQIRAWLEAEYKVLGGEVSLSNIQVLEEGGDGGETRN